MGYSSLVMALRNLGMHFYDADFNFSSHVYQSRSLSQYWEQEMKNGAYTPLSTTELLLFEVLMVADTTPCDCPPCRSYSNLSNTRPFK